MVTHATEIGRLRNDTWTSTETALAVPDASACGCNILMRDLITTAPLLLSDALAIILCWSAVRSLNLLAPSLLDAPRLTMLVASLVLIPITFAMLELYPAVGLLPAAEIKRQLIGVGILLNAFITVRLCSPPVDLEELAAIALCGALLAMMAPAFRLATRGWFGRYDWWKQPTYVFGRDQEMFQWITCLEQCPELGMRWTDRELPCRALVTSDAEIQMGLQISDLTMLVPRVVMVSTEALREASTQAQRAALLCGPSVKNRLLLPQYRLCKRVFDLCLIGISLPVLLPVVLLISLIVKATSPGPIFFCQERPGRRGVRFRAWKFRTMVVDAEQRLEYFLAADRKLRKEWERDHKLKNDPRVTRIGTILRKTSLDELPQLWNVLRGEMSLIGPRPIVDAEVGKYGEVYRLYELVMPGLSGLWQVSGRNNTTYEERVALDSHYVRSWSPWYDIYLLIRTARTVLLREGAY